ncbi:MAG: RraA family protein [Hellea sp.]
MNDLIRSLTQFDTPTISNAIEVVQGGRGYDRFTRGTPVHAMNGAKAMCGYARTAKLTGLKPPIERQDVIRARRLDYYRYMAAGDEPTVCVVEDVDVPNAVCAWWGEVHSAVHKGLGMSGALTNGLLRDLDELDEGFPIVAGSIGPSHMFVHVTEFDTPVTIFDMTINPGELVHADKHGAVIIPEDVLPKLAEGIKTLLAGERIILGPAREPGFNIDKLLEAWEKFEEART